MAKSPIVNFTCPMCGQEIEDPVKQLGTECIKCGMSIIPLDSRRVCDSCQKKHDEEFEARVTWEEFCTWCKKHVDGSCGYPDATISASKKDCDFLKWVKEQRRG